MRIFVAGATGVIGKRLIPQLIAAGHEVVATTKSPEKVRGLVEQGAKPIILDGLDAMAIGQAVAEAEPEVVIHQMTSLVGMGNLRRFDREFALTNKLRTRGTDHLLTASAAVGVRRFIAQSYTGWTNERAGGPVKTEDDPLDPSPPAAQQETMRAIKYLEDRVLGVAGIEGIVLRYGSFYGPGASDKLIELLRKRKMPVAGDGAGIWSWAHVDDAARATVQALQLGSPGIYNIVDDEPASVAQWLPFLANAVGTKPPLRIPVWLARLAAGDVAVSMLTQIRGSSNAKAKLALQWQPKWKSWRDGFSYGLKDDDHTFRSL